MSSNPIPSPSPSPTPNRLEAVYVETAEVLLAADPVVGDEVEEAPQLHVLVRHRRPRQAEARLAALERLEGGEVRLALGVLERVHLSRRCKGGAGEVRRCRGDAGEVHLVEEGHRPLDLTHGARVLEEHAVRRQQHLAPALLRLVRGRVRVRVRVRVWVRVRVRVSTRPPSPGQGEGQG